MLFVKSMPVNFCSLCFEKKNIVVKELLTVNDIKKDTNQIKHVGYNHVSPGSPIV